MGVLTVCVGVCSRESKSFYTVQTHHKPNEPHLRATRNGTILPLKRLPHDKIGDVDEDGDLVVAPIHALDLQSKDEGEVLGEVHVIDEHARPHVTVETKVKSLLSLVVAKGNDGGEGGGFGGDW